MGSFERSSSRRVKGDGFSRATPETNRSGFSAEVTLSGLSTLSINVEPSNQHKKNHLEHKNSRQNLPVTPTQPIIMKI
jgi:hypothetical protein